MDIDKRLEILVNTKSDINEHLPTLLEYGKECKHITEMGVRWVVSTWAFLCARPETLISYDIQHPSKWGADINDVYNAANQIHTSYSFRLSDVLAVNIEPTDLLFIDTLHQYKQLKQELDKHASKVNKYIVLHDTSKFEFIDELSGAQGGLWPAIEEFLSNNSGWELLKRYTNNNGLTILSKTIA